MSHEPIAPRTTIRHITTGATGSFATVCRGCMIRGVPTTACYGVTISPACGGTLMEYWRAEDCEVIAGSPTQEASHAEEGAQGR